MAFFALRPDHMRCWNIFGSRVGPAIWRGKQLASHRAWRPSYATTCVHVVQVFLEWSKESYAAQFSIYHDNIATKSYEQQLVAECIDVCNNYTFIFPFPSPSPQSTSLVLKAVF